MTANKNFVHFAHSYQEGIIRYVVQNYYSAQYYREGDKKSEDKLKSGSFEMRKIMERDEKTFSNSVDHEAHY